MNFSECIEMVEFTVDSESRKQVVDSYLSKEFTLIIKGVAVILLLSHHLWAFPERLPGSITGITDYVFRGSLLIAGDFGRICVAVFAFLSGYGKYIKYADKKINTFRDIRKMYFLYWRVFLIFIPVAFIFFRNQMPYCQDEMVYSCYKVFSVRELVLNFFGLLSTYNREWWFLSTYIICTAMFPLIRKMADKLSVLMYVFIVLCFQLAFLMLDRTGIFKLNDIADNIFKYLMPYVVCFCSGVLIAKRAVYSFIAEKTAKLRFKPLLSLGLIILVFVLREVLSMLTLEFLFVILFVYALRMLLPDTVRINKIFAFLGRYSSYMWLTHSFFCYYFGIAAKSIVFFKWSLITLLILTGYSLAASVLIDFIWNSIDRGCVKIAEHFHVSRRDE